METPNYSEPHYMYTVSAMIAPFGREFLNAYCLWINSALKDEEGSVVLSGSTQ